jgi:nitrate reductase cytochrome c-type subunit
MSTEGAYRRLFQLTLLGGLALVLAGCVVAPGVAPGPPRADAPDLVALHAAKSPAYDKNCLSCHGDIMKRTTRDPRFKEAHAAMVPFAPGYDAKVGVTNETCVSCHGSVDLVQHSGEQIRKNADVASCAACHSKSGPSTKKFYAN